MMTILQLFFFIFIFQASVLNLKWTGLLVCHKRMKTIQQFIAPDIFIVIVHYSTQWNFNHKGRAKHWLFSWIHDITPLTVPGSLLVQNVYLQMVRLLVSQELNTVINISFSRMLILIFSSTDQRYSWVWVFCQCKIFNNN